MSSKESNLKEKFKQALESTARVISDDLKIKENPKQNKSSKKFDFFEIDNLTTKSDFIKFRAETDSNALKKKFSNEIGIICDVALDPYTSHGHDGILKNNIVNNDETIQVLIKQSLIQAEAGCDIIAPSDMMDGRIGEIRKSLEKNNFKDTLILSYAAKYASNFYGPFRDAVGSAAKLKSDKKNYQMDFHNANESIREVDLDINEGADMVMIKPGLAYLDIISKIKENYNIPLIAYNVSGEYSMMKHAINNKILPEDAIYEMMISFKRAGANAIVTYFAIDICEKFLKN